MKKEERGIEIKQSKNYTTNAKKATFFDKDGNEIGTTDIANGTFTAPKNAIGFKIKA